MSKKSEKRATRLVQESELRARVIRRVVREYGDNVRKSAIPDPAKQVKSQQEIERAVLKYNEVHKALKRLRKRIQLEQ